MSGMSAGGLYARIKARGRAEFLVRERASLRYDQLLRDLHGTCGVFAAHRLEPGDRVMIVTADEELAITVFLAALLDGLVPVMLTPETPAVRAASVAEAISPRLILADAARGAESWAASALTVVPPARGLLGRLRAGPAGFRSLIGGAGRVPRLPDTPNNLAYVLYTSGTTSAPQGAMITHRNLFSHLETLSRLFDYGPDSRIFNGMVLAHGDGLVQGPLLAVANGCALIRPEPFSTPGMEDWLNSVRALGATHVLSVPTVYSLVDRYARHHDYFEGCRLISVAAKLDEALWRRLENRFGVPIFNQFGLTETVASGLYAGPHPEMGPVGTIGRPIDMAARILRPDGRDAGACGTGELWLSGNNVFAGYWGDRGRTADVLTADGWLRTGDLALRRPDGAYEIRGRLKTVIMCGGFLIRPEEIDEALLGHPAVAEAATVGVSDPDFGEIPVSAIVLDAHADEIELTEHCRAMLEPMKVPRRIVVLKAIPRGDAGKPRLGVLRDLLHPGAPAPDGESRRTTEAVLRVASQTFRVPMDLISLEATPENLPAWDSFAHINLILAAERHFQVRIPTADVAAIRSLRELADAIERAS